MEQDFFITIDEVVDLLGLERDPRSIPGNDSYNVRCPFCGDAKYKMNINAAKNVYHCFRCSSDGANTGVLDLYGRVRLGERFVPGPSGNGKELSRKLRDEMGAGTGRVSRPVFGGGVKEIAPAPDEVLDRVYAALLSLPYLKLSDEHRTNLRSRGLTDEVIDRNGYATMPRSAQWAETHPKYAAAKRIYEEKELEKEKNACPKLLKTGRESVIAGILIANDVRTGGAEPDGVPGFFRLKGTWVFLAEPGILIPTRNLDGEIVGLQVRRDNVPEGGVRYLTVSSKGLKCGTNTRISRTHFPLCNARLDPEGRNNPKVILTEGPLKADVAASLYEPPAFFMAVQGVNNIREMPGIAAYLGLFGVKSVYNAFDMDKICNPHVARAGRNIRKIFERESIRTLPMVWDYMDYIRTYEEDLKRYCSERSIEWKEFSDELIAISRNINALAEMGRDFDTFRQTHPWHGAKGIDDFLLAQKQKRESRNI